MTRLAKLRSEAYSYPRRNQTPLDEEITAQFEFDWRTGVQTAIGRKSNCNRQRAACAALNRRRASGILEAASFAASRESISVDVWDAQFARRCAEWDVPLIRLESLGIVPDADGYLESKELIALKSGAEARPYHYKGTGH